MIIVRRNIPRADRDPTDRLAAFGATTLHEAIGHVGLMKPTMRPIQTGARISGTAVTVLLQPGGNRMMHVVAEQIQPGGIVWRAPRRTARTAISATCSPRASWRAGLAASSSP